MFAQLHFQNTHTLSKNDSYYHHVKNTNTHTHVRVYFQQMIAIITMLETTESKLKSLFPQSFSRNFKLWDREKYKLSTKLVVTFCFVFREMVSL